jgi:hypothetical protein
MKGRAGEMRGPDYYSSNRGGMRGAQRRNVAARPGCVWSERLRKKGRPRPALQNRSTAVSKLCCEGRGGPPWEVVRRLMHSDPHHGSLARDAPYIFLTAPAKNPPLRRDRHGRHTLVRHSLSEPERALTRPSHHHSQFYVPPPHYLPGVQAQIHVPPSSRVEVAPQQRKRPKYTRSKTGCMTCRIKKVKVPTRALLSVSGANSVFPSATRRNRTACVVRTVNETCVFPLIAYHLTKFYSVHLARKCSCSQEDFVKTRRSGPQNFTGRIVRQAV